MPKFWNTKVLLAKIETTYGVDAVPTGAANAILAQQVRIQPMEGQDVARELDRPLFAADGTVAADLHAKLTFRVELAASGVAGTAPGWSALMRACGCAQTIAAGTSVTFNPISTGIESATIHFHYDGIRHRLRGARGTFRIGIEASAIPYIEFEFTGLFEPADDSANPAADLAAFLTPQIVNTANTPVFTVDGDAMVMRSFMFNAGVQVEPRFLVGSESILITGRSEQVECTVEAVAMSTFNPYTAARDATKLPIVLQHGTAAGSRVTLNLPLAQMQRPGGVEGQQNVAEWPLRFVPHPDAGNDQWTLVLT